MRRILCCVIASSVVWLALALPGHVSASARPYESLVQYSMDTPFSFENNTPYAKPKWVVDMGKPDADWRSEDRVALNRERIFYLHDRVLVGANVHTGKMIWRFGKSMHGPILLSGDFLYAASNEGTLYKVVASTGKLVWKLQLTESQKPSRPTNRVIASFTLDNDILLVATWGSVVTIDAQTGKQRWKNSDVRGVVQPIVAGKILLFPTSEQGVISVGTTYAIDRTTGRTLWRLQGDHDRPLEMDGKFGYFRDVSFGVKSPTHQVKIDVVELLTGKIVSVKQVVPLSKTQDAMNHQASKVVGSGGKLYVQTKEGPIHMYALAADAPSNPLAIIRHRGTWIAGPSDGKLYFKDNNVEEFLVAAKVADGNKVYYQGIDNPVSRMDFIGSTLLAGQTDGKVIAADLRTGKAHFRFQTKARQFGPFKANHNMVFVQAESQLYAFELPTSALELPTKEATAFQSMPIKLLIDGKQTQLKPDPIAVNNFVFFPMRHLFESIGAKVVEDPLSLSTTVTYRGRSFTIQEGTAHAVAGKEKKSLLFAPMTYQGDLYVALRDVASLLGVQLQWDYAKRTAVVTTTSP